MSRYIETIQLRNGELLNPEFHQERFERTRSKALGLKKHPLLTAVLQIPHGLEQGIFKCRVLYKKEIELVEYEAYQSRRIRSLKLVYSDDIEYGYKEEDRGELERLFRLREDCDDILIVKNECISDSFYANVVLWSGETWVTPDTPLLRGTMRASLLKKGKIFESRITPGNLARYQKLRLINAMNDLEEAVDIPINSIH